MTAALAAAFMLSGCGMNRETGPGLTPQPAADEIEITFINSWGGVDSNAGTLQAIFDDFMQENPGIRVVNESIFGDDFLVKLKTDFTSGNAPDVFGIWPGSDIQALIAAGKVADLTEVLEADPEWKALFSEESFAFTTVDGHIYGLPVEIIYEALFLNTDIFDRFGVGPPKTYEDLCVLVRLFKNKAVTPIAYNYLSEGSYIYQNIVTRLGGREGVENYGECYIRGMEVMKGLYDIYAFPENAYELSDFERNELFLTGKAAMIVQGSWFTRNIYEAGMSGNVDIVPFPSFDKENPDDYELVYGLGCGTFYMSRNAWNDEAKREASLKLLRKLTSPEASMMLTSGSGFISSIDMSSVMQAESTMYRKGRDLINGASELVPPPDSVVDRTVWDTVIVPSFVDVYEGDSEEIRGIWAEALSLLKND